jgi:hypothetical protein
MQNLIVLPLLIALTTLNVAEAGGTAWSKSSYTYKTAWVSHQEQIDECTLVDTYVGLYINKSTSTNDPPSKYVDVTVSRYTYNTCTGEYLGSEYGYGAPTEWRWKNTKKGQEVSLDAVVTITGGNEATATTVEVPITLTWNDWVWEYENDTSSKYRTPCGNQSSFSTYSSNAWGTQVQGVIGGLNLPSENATSRVEEGNSLYRTWVLPCKKK